MATMDSISTWSSAAGDRERGVAWRDAVTERMIRAGRYVPYEDLVADAAVEHHLSPDAPRRLWAAWSRMRRWPDASALEKLRIPYAFVTNCSAERATVAAARSGLEPAFMLSAEEAGWYKPRAEIYRLACERIGLRPDRVRFVAGAAYDALGAAGAGLQAVLVARRPASGDLPDEITMVASLEDAVHVG
ncbi:MAG: HAD-IA family hydrolase [Candidatus Limnocylindria bacterium]